MWEEDFKELRAWVSSGDIEPVLLKLQNLTDAAEITIGTELVDILTLLSARHYHLLLERIKSGQSPGAIQRQVNILFSDLLNYISILERRTRGTVPPARGPRLSMKDVPSNRLRDPQFREALIRGSAFRSVSWFENAIRASIAVCKIQSARSVATGFIVGDGLLITNNHVLSTIQLASTATAIFNYQQDQLGHPLPSTVFGLDPAKLFLTDEDLDCTIVAIKASSGELTRWGRLAIGIGSDLLIGSAISIIQHPDGGYKQVALLGNMLLDDDRRRLLYGTSTMPGSSGAPVFDENWNVVALHQGAGVWSKQEGWYTHNQGIRFSAISQKAEFAAALQAA